MDVRKKLIDANYLLNEIRDDHNINGANFSRIRQHIEVAPAVDAVEVVRCGKCKNFRPYDGEEHKGDCAELVGLESCVYEDDFCSYGERKEGVTDGC